MVADYPNVPKQQHDSERLVRGEWRPSQKLLLLASESAHRSAGTAPAGAPFVQIGEEKREEIPGSGILLRVSGCEAEIHEGTSTELIERTL